MDKLLRVFDTMSATDNLTEKGIDKLWEQILAYLRIGGRLNIYCRRSIEICERCGGDGFVQVEKDPISQDIIDEVCNRCDGHGRVRVIKTKRIEKLNIGEAGA